MDVLLDYVDRIESLPDYQDEEAQITVPREWLEELSRELRSYLNFREESEANGDLGRFEE